MIQCKILDGIATTDITECFENQEKQTGRHSKVGSQLELWYLPGNKKMYIKAFK